MTTVLLSCCLATVPPPSQSQPAAAGDTIQFEIRVFDGTAEVTAETRVTIYPTGTRDPTAAISPKAGGRLVIIVPPGIYDLQAIRVRLGQVVGVKWAENLAVMRYPEEGGRHLEVINFKPGFGALQLRPAPGEGVDRASWDAAIYAAGDRAREAGQAIKDADFILFVLPAGKYDVLLRRGAESTWWSNTDVPPGRTRVRQILVTGR